MNELPERLPSRPLRNWFLAWHIHTGDPAEVIAKGFDLEPALVADLLSGEVPLMMPLATSLEVCAATRVAPSELWAIGLGVAGVSPRACDPLCGEMGPEASLLIDRKG